MKITILSLAVKELKPIEVAIYATLKRWSKRDAKGKLFSDLTEEQIADRIKASRRSVTESINKDYLKGLGVSIVKVTGENGFKRNIYYFKKEKNYFAVNTEVIDSLEFRQLGMLLKLKSISYNNQINGDNKEIAEKIAVSIPTLRKYINLTQYLTNTNFPVYENKYLQVIREFCCLKGAKINGINLHSKLLLPFYETRFKGDFRAFLGYLSQRFKNLPQFVSLNYFSKVITGERSISRRKSNPIKYIYL